MKKISITIISIAILLSPTIVRAQTATPTITPKITSSPTSIGDSSQIEKIKDLVASRVAELKLVEKRGILGTVSSTTSTSVTLVDLNNKRKIVDIDEITKFSDPESKEYGISDIKKGNVIGVIGLLNKGSDHLLARVISTVSTIPTYFDGIITNVDRRNFVITAVDEDGNKKLLDIETSTKLFSYTKETEEIKSGFSKITPGERIYAAGFPDSKVANQINIDRLTHYPELVPSSKMKRFAETEAVTSVTVAPTTKAATPTSTKR